MLNRLAPLALTLTLAGCVTLTHPQYGTSRLQQDARECDEWAQIQAASMPSGMDRGWRMGELTRMCMSRLGYVRAQ